MMSKDERRACMDLRFFAHEWEPPEEDDERLPIHLRTHREINWLWDRVLPRGGTSILAGAPKSGKTTLVTDLAVAHARGGGEFLGRGMSQGMVVILMLEGNDDEVIKRAKTMGKGQKLPLWVLTMRAKSLEDAKYQTVEIIKRESPSLLIIDTLWKFSRAKDINDYPSMGEGTEVLDNLAREYGTHILAVHHTKKSSKGDLSDVLGATSITGGVDTILQLVKLRSGVRKVWSTQRHGDDIEPVGLVKTKSGQLVEVDLAGDLKKEVLDVLTVQGEVGLLKLRAMLKCNLNSLISIMKDLVDQEVIERRGMGMKGNPWVYKITAPPPHKR